MLCVTTHVQKDKLNLTPVKTLCELKIKAVPDIDDLLKPFGVSILIPKDQRPPEEYIGHLQISAPFGWTNMSNIATGVAVYILSVYAARNNKQVQFLAGSFGENVGELLVPALVKSDSVSILLQGDVIYIPDDLCKKVRCEGFDSKSICWL